MSKELRDHQRELAFIKVLQGPSGFDILLLVGVAAGYGSAGAVKLLKSMGVDIDEATGNGTDKTGKKISIPGVILGATTGGIGGAFIGGFKSDSPMSLCENIPATFANACLFLLTVRSMFGTSAGGSTGEGSGLGKSLL